MKRRYTKKQIMEAIAYWQKVLEDMDAGTGETIKIPSGDKPREVFAGFEEDFITWADSKFKGGVYSNVVSDEAEEVEGTQRDLDDFDIYRYSQQDALDEETFWDRIFEKMYDEYPDGKELPAEKILHWLKVAGEEIAIDAFENFDAGEEYCVHVGRWKPESYWRA